MNTAQMTGIIFLLAVTIACWFIVFGGDDS